MNKMVSKMLGWFIVMLILLFLAVAFFMAAGLGIGIIAKVAKWVVSL